VNIGVISVFTDYHRRGAHHRGVLQPQIGPLIAALLPDHARVHIVNDAWDDPDWNRRYDLLFISCLHSDFDRARQISHYWRRRGAKTVLGGTMASTYAALCAPYFDTIAVGDPEALVAEIVADFEAGTLQSRYTATPFDARRVPHPRLDLAARQQVLPLAIEATRGCPFTCEFCALTGIGTRFHTRPAQSIADELTAGQRALAGIASWLHRHIAIFYDNNLGGNPAHMREVCAALEPLGIRWGACVTFNVICDEQNVKALAAGGCRCVFVGLESFNRDTIREMGKHQNVLAETAAAIRMCHDNGILVMAGLMLSPSNDSIEYIDSIPAQLRAVGLHVPTYICFETPFPGTPHFQRLAASGEGALMPNTLLRDLNGYTLAVPPREATPEAFVEAYKRTWERIFSPRARLAKFLADLPRLALRGRAAPLLFNLYELFFAGAALNGARTFIAGTDIEPPEAREVPLTDADFDSAEQRAQIMEPWRVSDEAGSVLPMWRASTTLYRAKGRINDAALAPVPVHVHGRGHEAGGSRAHPRQPAVDVALAPVFDLGSCGAAKS
jgi:radical SAM superfamily enzyme YgiQ (UPF0313 family)